MRALVVIVGRERAGDYETLQDDSICSATPIY